MKFGTSAPLNPFDANAPLSVRETARLLEISENSVRKLIDSHVIRVDEGMRNQVYTLTNLPALTVTEGRLPVVRSGPFQEAAPVPGDPRTWLGYDDDASDDEILVANNRWWDFDPDLVLDAGMLLITVVTVPVALLRVDGIAATTREFGTLRYQFDGPLLARYNGMRNFDEIDKSAGVGLDRDVVDQIMNSRVYTVSGGVKAYLPPLD